MATNSRYLLRHRALYLYIVIDKPDFLPPPWLIVHRSPARTHKSNQASTIDPAVTDDALIPRGKEYSTILANCPQFKVKLIEYITSKYQAQAVSSTKQSNFPDSPPLPLLLTIRDGCVFTSEGNEHGEADCAIWHHFIIQ